MAPAARPLHKPPAHDPVTDMSMSRSETSLPPGDAPPAAVSPRGPVAGPAAAVDEQRPFYSQPLRSEFPLSNKLARLGWGVVSAVLFRLSPVPCFGWRRALLRAFGGRIAPTALVYPSARIWAPWNLTMEAGAALGPEVHCYDVGPVHIGVDATISLRTFLCGASHDISHPARPLVIGAIHVKRGAYVFAESFIGTGVTVGEGAVVSARAVVVRDVADYDVVSGNPARVVGRRRLSAPESEPSAG
jgi:putative colanic acid biosynthesis acetyltransferase WcaF